MLLCPGAELLALYDFLSVGVLLKHVAPITQLRHLFLYLGGACGRPPFYLLNRRRDFRFGNLVGYCSDYRPDFLILLQKLRQMNALVRPEINFQIPQILNQCGGFLSRGAVHLPCRLILADNLNTIRGITPQRCIPDRLRLSGQPFIKLRVFQHVADIGMFLLYLPQQCLTRPLLFLRCTFRPALFRFLKGRQLLLITSLFLSRFSFRLLIAGLVLILLGAFFSPFSPFSLFLTFGLFPACLCAFRGSITILALRGAFLRFRFPVAWGLTRLGSGIGFFLCAYFFALRLLRFGALLAAFGGGLCSRRFVFVEGFVEYVFVKLL